MLRDLDNEIEEPDFKIKDEMIISVPDYTMTLEKLRKRQDMDNPKFWLQKGIEQTNQGKVDAAMDYYRQGLREKDYPRSKDKKEKPKHHDKHAENILKLIYNLANSYKKKKQYHNSLRWFAHGVGLFPRWVNGLVGLATTCFNMH